MKAAHGLNNVFRNSSFRNVECISRMKWEKYQFEQYVQVVMLTWRAQTWALQIRFAIPVEGCWKRSKGSKGSYISMAVAAFILLNSVSARTSFIISGHFWAINWPSLAPAAGSVEFLWFKMAGTGVPGNSIVYRNSKWWGSIIWWKVTIIFDAIALEMACRPVRVQTGEWKVVLRRLLE